MIYKVWIYDDESGCEQPIRCKATGEAHARSIGNRYIQMWNLVGGMITKVEKEE